MIRCLNPGAAGSSPFELVAIGDRATSWWWWTPINYGNRSYRVVDDRWAERRNLTGMGGPGRFPGYTIRHLTVLGSQLLFHATDCCRSHGVGTNIELYPLEVSGFEASSRMAYPGTNFALFVHGENKTNQERGENTAAAPHSLTWVSPAEHRVRTKRARRPWFS